MKYEITIYDVFYTEDRYIKITTTSEDDMKELVRIMTESKKPIKIVSEG